VADGRSAALLGVSEQLIGRRALGARGHTWCGNLVPARLPASERHALSGAAREICAHLAAAFGLRGLFGVDLVWDGAQAWVVEVNPRPSASLETIEAVHGVRSIGAHLDACAGRLPPAERAGPPTGAAGKAVVYATEDVRVPDTREWADRGIRDVPHPGEPIAAGHPICTLVATGPSPEAVLAGLEARAAALRAELHHHAGVDVLA
jgi:predicted ATP-grasp superfamily ATP-dependent carboligase